MVLRVGCSSHVALMESLTSSSLLDCHLLCCPSFSFLIVHVAKSRKSRQFACRVFAALFAEMRELGHLATEINERRRLAQFRYSSDVASLYFAGS